MKQIPVSALSLNQLTRDYWGSYDASAIALLAELADDPCFQMRFYHAPADDQENLQLALPAIPAVGYSQVSNFVTYGLQITPGSIIFGFYLPIVVNGLSPTTPVSWPPKTAFTLQITDVSTGHSFWDEPIGSVFLANLKPTYQPAGNVNLSNFPNLLCAPYPVTGSGLFDVEIQNTAATAQSVELVLGVLEVCNVG